MSTIAAQYEAVINAARHRWPGPLTTTLTAYTTPGGTYVIASNPDWNDDDLPHDLVAVIALPNLDGTRVVPLRANVNPELVAALRAALDEASAA